MKIFRSRLPVPVDTGRIDSIGCWNSHLWSLERWLRTPILSSGGLLDFREDWRCPSWQDLEKAMRIVRSCLPIASSPIASFPKASLYIPYLPITCTITSNKSYLVYDSVKFWDNSSKHEVSWNSWNQECLWPLKTQILRNCMCLRATTP